MGYDNILGQILQQGLGQGSPTRDRLDTAGRDLGASSGMDAIFKQVQEALRGAGIPTGGTAGSTGGTAEAAGGLADMARDFLQKDQVGGLSGAQLGGIGAAAGALLGGGLGGAARGGAMAVLGTLALGALKRAQAKASGIPSSDLDQDGALQVDPDEVRSLVDEDSERSVLRAMISAAKADGRIDRDEIGKIVSKMTADSVTEDEKAFVREEMERPIDLAALASKVRTPAQAAEIYAASLLAISVDTAEEQRYLHDLTAALDLDAATVAELHRMTGAPSA